ncbi:hypothetical protein EYF80_043005 [Liparis tanakae]|uniref:Uncharacterized protein n=1 Tax=Liparis tanakae TaxID=230148 RepID=A0A4Z2G1S2_9TELE|nr:hypothetical protein EYF80_043005 [Liparis tanakae]
MLPPDDLDAFDLLPSTIDCELTPIKQEAQFHQEFQLQRGLWGGLHRGLHRGLQGGLHRGLQGGI